MKTWALVAASLLAAGVVTFGLVYRTGVASGADSYGYVSQADLWRSGSLHIRQEFAKQLPWPDAGKTASPYGYEPAPESEIDTIVPWYSPGLPMLMAIAKSIGGHAAMFWVVPLFGGLLVIATFFIGLRFGGASVGLASAFLTALSPVVLYMSLLPMSDVVTGGLWAAVTWAVLGDSRRRALAGGALTALAILVRPNLVGVGALVGVWVLARDLGRGSAPRRVDRAIAFAIGAAPGIAGVMLFNRALYGSPFVSGYGTLGSVLHAANVIPNIHRYASWLFRSETPFVLIGLLPLALPIARIWGDRARAADAALFSLIAIATLSCYLSFQPLDEWWYVRFLLPMWPGLFVGLSWLLFNGAGRARAIVATLLILAVGAHGVWFGRHQRIAKVAEGERRFVTAAELTRAHTEPNSVIFSMVHSGSVRYYGERMTLRYDQLPPEWLDPGVEWLSRHGAHPYLLIEDWERATWKARFGEASALARIDRGVVFELQWPTHMWLFDLARPAAPSWPVILGYDAPPVPRSVPPAAPPSLVFR